jgi:ribose/xylose/arabinose/galactoside ABC-type transport system permease subunit
MTIDPGTIDRTGPGAPDGRSSGRSTFTLDRVAAAVPLVVLGALVIIATVANEHFWTTANIRNILTQNAPLALVAFGMTAVLICGVFDLSVGAIVAAGAVTFALSAEHVILPVAALLAILVGAAAGAINGYVVAGLKVNAFIGTIATGAIFTGLVFIGSGSSPVQLTADGYSTIGLGRIGPVPWALVVVIAVYLLLAGLLNRTVIGRYVFATGGNSKAARLNGVPVGLITAGSFVVGGALSALAGVITASQLGLGQPTLGANTALDAFAIVVIGGTSVFGGRGAMWRTIVGLLIIALMTNILNSLAWDSTTQSLTKGIVLLLAVALEAKRYGSR